MRLLRTIEPSSMRQGVAGLQRRSINSRSTSERLSKTATSMPHSRTSSSSMIRKSEAHINHWAHFLFWVFRACVLFWPWVFRACLARFEAFTAMVHCFGHGHGFLPMMGKFPTTTLGTAQTSCQESIQSGSAMHPCCVSATSCPSLLSSQRLV